MKPQLNSPAFAFGFSSLLYLVLFVFARSPSTQPSGFTLTLDLDAAAGDQSVSSLDPLPDQPFAIQIFGTDVQGATGISVRLRFDAS